MLAGKVNFSSKSDSAAAEAPQSGVRSSHKFDEGKLTEYLVSQEVLKSGQEVCGI
jgi:hypothetical protein